MAQIIYGLKREYWEHKRLLIGMPLLVSALFCLVCIVTTWTHYNPGADVALKENGDKSEVVVDLDIDFNKAEQNTLISIDPQKDSDENSVGENFWFSGMYLATAWLAAMFYALSSLYNDRRDKSILYWKTMPVSELCTVLHKYLFAVVGFSAVAIAISWITAMVLMGYASLVFPPEMLADDSAGMSARKLIVWPILAVIVATAWCAPVFALLLYVSAKVKKMPVLSLVVVVVVIRVVERIVFRSDHIFSFLYAHSPLGLLGGFDLTGTAADFLRTYLVDSFASLLFGMVLAAILVWRTAWHRDHSFEM